jgi:hypothetical protein
VRRLRAGSGARVVRRAATAAVVRLTLVRPMPLCVASELRVDVPRASRWGEPVEQFISCLLQHARDRYFVAEDDDSWLNIPYWVCAYANNQWEYAPVSACACCRTCAPELRVRAG